MNYSMVFPGLDFDGLQPPPSNTNDDVISISFRLGGPGTNGLHVLNIYGPVNGMLRQDDTNMFAFPDDSFVLGRWRDSDETLTGPGGTRLDMDSVALSSVMDDLVADWINVRVATKAFPMGRCEVRSPTGIQPSSRNNSTVAPLKLPSTTRVSANMKSNRRLIFQPDLSSPTSSHFTVSFAPWILERSPNPDASTGYASTLCFRCTSAPSRNRSRLHHGDRRLPRSVPPVRPQHSTNGTRTEFRQLAQPTQLTRSSRHKTLTRERSLPHFHTRPVPSTVQRPN
ncbi:MAG: hypothetical protein CMO80_17505 [Verrucomicrobiales bacterium]|nr:hypothetical protein [Verrucomicrobiales bacterium]